MGLVNYELRHMFYKIGSMVAKHPKFFIILPVLLSLGLGSCVYFNFHYISNVEQLYTHTNGPGTVERNITETYFPPKEHESFTPSRTVRIGRTARIIITAKDNGSLLHSDIWKEILEVDRLIRNTSIEWHGKQFNYSTLCGKYENLCYENDILDLGFFMDSIENGSTLVNYPVMFNPRTFKTHILPQSLGGLQYSSSSFSVVSVEALLLQYFIAVDNMEDDSRGEKWEEKLLETLEVINPKKINIYRFTIKSLSSEQERNTFSVIPHFVVTSFLMCAFAFVSSMSSDCVRSKPWVSQVGIFSSLLGTIAGCGVLSIVGVNFINLNMAVPFIMIGIGIDDTFVILASWRRTSIKDSVAHRLGQCYREAAVSITVTTLTDMLSFFIGVLTPIQSVRIFSAYAGTCVLFIYIYQIFFFGALLSISGHQEAKNKNALFFWKTATPKSLSGNKSFLYRLFFTGGISKLDPSNPMDNGGSGAMTFFHNSFSKFLSKAYVKVLVLSIFLLYIVTSCWGISMVQDELHRENLIRTDSYLADFLRLENKYFKELPYRVQILITTPLDYSLPETQEKVKQLLKKFSNLDYIAREYSENWLKDFNTHVKNYEEFYNFNVSTEQQFINTLMGDYFQNSSKVVTSLDVKLNANRTKIIASRYILQATKVYSSNDERDMTIQLREIAKKCTDFDVVVFNPWFHFIDQFIIITELTYTLICFAGMVVILVSLVFISNLICTICVFFCIVSIEVGVIGFMSIWGVNLDIVSLIFLIMCVGFSVDFSAHVAYAYVSSNGYNSHERVQKAMYALGLPILQGATSTIIGVIALVIVPSYIFQTMFKIVLLVIVFATFHGLFILPVLLQIIQPEKLHCKGMCPRKVTKSDDYDITRGD